MEHIRELQHTSGFKGIWIPKEVLFDDNLTFLDKMLLMEITYLDDDKHCYASNEHLAEFLGCSQSAVSKSINKLCNLKYVNKVKFDGRIRYLSSNLHYTLKNN